MRESAVCRFNLDSCTLSVYHIYSLYSALLQEKVNTATHDEQNDDFVSSFRISFQGVFFAIKTVKSHEQDKKNLLIVKSILYFLQCFKILSERSTRLEPEPLASVRLSGCLSPGQAFLV